MQRTCESSGCSKAHQLSVIETQWGKHCHYYFHSARQSILKTAYYLPDSSLWENRLKSAISMLPKLWEKYLMHFCWSIITISLSRQPAGLKKCCVLFDSSHQCCLIYIIFMCVALSQDFSWRSNFQRSFLYINSFVKSEAYPESISSLNP